MSLVALVAVGLAVVLAGAVLWQGKLSLWARVLLVLLAVLAMLMTLLGGISMP